MPLIDCNKCIGKKVCVYSKIKSEYAKRLWNESKRICFHKEGDIIFSIGDIPNSFFIVCSGKVKISKPSSSGNNIVIGIKTQGSIFGYSCMCREDIYNTTATSMDNSTIGIFPKKLWLDILKSDFEFSVEIMKLMCIEIGYLQSRISHIAYKTADEKIASALINHIRFTSHDEAKPEVIHLKRIDIAEMCGLRIETVVRTLQKFEKKNIIERKGVNIKIININELINISNNNN